MGLMSYIEKTMGNPVYDVTLESMQDDEMDFEFALEEVIDASINDEDIDAIIDDEDIDNLALDEALESYLNEDRDELDVAIESFLGGLDEPDDDIDMAIESFLGNLEYNEDDDIEAVVESLFSDDDSYDLDKALEEYLEADVEDEQVILDPNDTTQEGEVNFDDIEGDFDKVSDDIDDLLESFLA